MDYKIGDKCIQCFACIMSGVCSEKAIIEHNEIFSIDRDKCNGCGTCFDKQQYFCPVRAIIEV